ncbi:MAG: hypothetical protein ACREO5_04905, partial [Candidatus Binatia bacterium]
AVAGQDTALGRAPRVREVTFCLHLVSSFNCCYAANLQGGNSNWKTRTLEIFLIYAKRIIRIEIRREQYLVFSAIKEM